MEERTVLIGELSDRTGTSRRSLRYYEQHDLLHATRTPAGWRSYDESAVVRVHNVRELLDAGMTVEDVRRVGPCLDAEDMLGCADDGSRADAVALHEHRLGVVEARLAVLAEHRDRLRERIARLHGPEAHR